MTVTFDGERAALKKGDEVLESSTQKLDPSKSPKTLDATIASGPHAGQVVLCIYKIDGDDTLTVCFDPDGKQRPTEFKGEPGSQTLAVYKRVKK